jgi:ABC-type sugar transport system substrate-binding protein
MSGFSLFKSRSFLIVCMVSVLTVWPAILGACSGADAVLPPDDSSAAENAETGQYRIGISFPTLQLAFRKRMMEIVQAEYSDPSRHPGVEIIIRDAEGSQKKQNQDIKELVDQRVDGIIVIPLTMEGPLPVIRYANQRGIPMMTLDNEVSSVSSARIVTYVGADHRQMGRMAAELFQRKLEERFPNDDIWNVLELTGISDSSGAVDRGDAIAEAFHSNERIHVLGRFNAEFTAELAKSEISDCLKIYPEIDGIICQNDLMAEGCFQALEEAGKAGDVVLVGIDGQKSVVQHVADGFMAGTIIQYPDMILDGVEKMLDELKGKALDPYYYTPVDTVTGENAWKLLDEGKPW